MRDKKVLPKLKLIIQHASKEATQLDDVKCRPEHLLLSLLTDNENIGTVTLRKMNIDTDRLYDKVSDFLRKTDLTPRLTISNRKQLPFSDETKAVFKQIDIESEKLNDDFLDVNHLMLAILAVSSGNTLIMLQKNNLKYSAYMTAMTELKNEFNNELNNEIMGNMFEDDEDDEGLKSNKRKKVETSKTPALDYFSRDVSKAVDKGEVDLVVGRNVEIKRVATILSRRKKNNPILIGEPGVGKTAILEGLALAIKNGEAPRPLAKKRIFALDLAAMVAGTKYRGQFEERMKTVIAECIANRDIVLFIDEIHTIVGAGGASGSMDASNMLKPALSRGEIQIIGATTLDEYRENIEKDGALTRRFQQVLVEEPTLEETKIILTKIKDKYELHHKVFYTNEAIDECVKLAQRYIMDRSMPDKAIDVMDEAGAATNMSIEKPENIVKLEKDLADITEEKLSVVRAQNYEVAAKLRDKEEKVKSELTTSTAEWNNKLTKKITTIGPEQIASVVSMMTGIPLTKISAQESKKLLDLESQLSSKLIGQDGAIFKVVKAIKRNRVGIKNKNKPVGSFIFLGPTGVGKTELSKLLAETVYGDADALIRFDMSEYMEKFSVSRLIGPPPGYVGYESGGQLTEKIRRKPHSVILFDEIEKAHEDVFNILLQVLDDGQLTDGLGRKVNFKNTLIIMTSNIGVFEMTAFGKPMGFETTNTIFAEEEKNRLIIEKALKKKFRPEFLNRIDEAIIFNKLKMEDIHKIIHCEIAKLETRIGEIGYKLEISTPAIEFIAEQGYDEAYGARPLNRAIQRYIEDPIADDILNGKINDGDTIKINFDKTKEEISLKVKKGK